MKTVLAAGGLDGWIRLEMSKGVLVKLTQAEFARAVQRGKEEKRAVEQARREQARQAAQESNTLAWIDEELSPRR